ncbi:MAG: UDP-glucose dehydrogenase family protein [Bacilli bacterium]
MKVAVAGTGYVGLVTGVSLANIGHNVTCVDIDKNKIEIMKKGISPIYEADLQDLMVKNKDRLNYTTDYKSAYKDAEVIIIGVGTPERADGSANLDYVYEVCKQIADSVERDCVVVIKSTVPIGTNDAIEKYLKENVKNGITISVASNPEFLAQGTAVRDTLHASRIVIGTESEEARIVLEKMYEPLTKEPYNVPLLSTNRRSAEMIKYASNDFLALKISYINEIANLCEKLGANIEDVAKGMGYDCRIGNKFLNAGIGYGGSCFPKDTKALHWLSVSEGVELKTVKACIEVNKNQKIRLYQKLLEDLKILKNKNIAILGLTFKPGTDDLREAPSIDNIELLLDAGANVRAYDPISIESFKKKINYKIENDGTIGTITYFSQIDDAINGADAALIMTEWPEIKNYDINNYKKLMKVPRVYDGRNCYSLESTKSIIYKSIGR